MLAAIRAHYTGSRGAPPGKKLGWRAFDGSGRVLAYLGLGEPAFKLAPRRRLGLEDARPALHTVSVWLYRRVDCVENRARVSGSELLGAWHPVAAADWEVRYGWAPEHWETMVGAEHVASVVPGACFRRAGYRALGLTTGRSARRPPGSTHGPRVWSDGPARLVLYRGPLARLDPRDGRPQVLQPAEPPAGPGKDNRVST
jgi:hypothetical protein